MLYLRRKREHPVEFTLWRLRNRSKVRGRPFSLTLLDVEALLSVEACESCGSALVGGQPSRLRPRARTIDERVHGKGYVPGNVGVLCGRCNSLKSDASPIEIRQLAAYVQRI